MAKVGLFLLHDGTKVELGHAPNLVRPVDLCWRPWLKTRPWLETRFRLLFTSDHHVLPLQASTFEGSVHYVPGAEHSSPTYTLVDTTVVTQVGCFCYIPGLSLPFMTSIGLGGPDVPGALDGLSMSIPFATQFKLPISTSNIWLP